MDVIFKIICITLLVTCTFFCYNGADDIQSATRTEYPSLQVKRNEYKDKFLGEETIDYQIVTNINAGIDGAVDQDTIDSFCPPESSKDKIINSQQCAGHRQCLFYKPIQAGKSKVLCENEILPVVKIVPVTESVIETDIYYKVGFVVIVATLDKNENNGSSGQTVYEEKWIELYSIRFDTEKDRPLSAEFKLYPSPSSASISKSKVFEAMNLQELQIMDKNYNRVQIQYHNYNFDGGELVVQKFVSFDEAECEVCIKATLFNFNMVLQLKSISDLWHEINQQIRVTLNNSSVVTVATVLHYENEKFGANDVKVEISPSLSNNPTSLFAIRNTDNAIMVLQPSRIVNLWGNSLIPSARITEQDPRGDKVLVIFLCDKACKLNEKKIKQDVLPQLNTTNIEGSVWQKVAKDLLGNDNVYVSEISWEAYSNLDGNKQGDETNSSVRDTEPTERKAIRLNVGNIGMRLMSFLFAFII